MSKYILVAGAINMDLVLKVKRLPLKGESIVGETIQFIPGGKGSNQAIAASRLGTSAAFIGKVGKDSYGTQLEDFLKSENLDLSGLGESNDPTGLALITVDVAGDNTIVCIPGASTNVTRYFIKKHIKLIKDANVIVSNFEIPLEAVDELFTIAKNSNNTTILNPSPALKAPFTLFQKVDYLILNETELSSMIGSKKILKKIDDITAAANFLRSHGPNVVVVTLGAKGAVTITNNDRIRTEGIIVKAVDTTAAGDCFIGAFATQINNGNKLSESLDFANKVAALSVQNAGASSSLPRLKDIKF